MQGNDNFLLQYDNDPYLLRGKYLFSCAAVTLVTQPKFSTETELVVTIHRS